MYYIQGSQRYLPDIYQLNKKIKFKGGLRAEYTKIDFNTQTSGTEKNHYFNLFPSFVISETIKSGGTIKFSYNRRVQRPSENYLNFYQLLNEVL